ncbi:hypothetical protein LTR94_038315, partial [Friedmanniomyces endolithicus]
QQGGRQGTGAGAGSRAHRGRRHPGRGLGRHRQARQDRLRAGRRQHHRAGWQDRHRRPALRRVCARRPPDRIAL